MTSPEYRVFDFREIAALDDAAVLFRNWLAKSSSFFSSFWGDASGYGAQLSLGPINTDTYGSVLESVPPEDYCCLAELTGHASSLWYASRNDLRLIVCELLCLADAEQLVGEELSPVEQALIQLFLDRLASSLGDGWMGLNELVIQAGSLDRDPRKTRIFRSKDLVTKTSLQVELKIGKVELHWLLPKQQISELLETTVDNRSDRQPVSPSTQMVGHLPIEVVSILGKATVPMTKLSQLEVGQLVMLDQRIDQPVTAYINDSPFFECWPGRLGGKQALEIAGCVNN
jgi:flagellar motor switch protein FliM